MKYDDYFWDEVGSIVLNILAVAALVIMALIIFE